jgi:DNA polymerase-3 subunit alpha
MVEQAPSEHPLPKVPDWTSQDKLSAEKEILGFYVSGHPLDQFMDKVNELATYRSGNLEGLA